MLNYFQKKRIYLWVKKLIDSKYIPFKRVKLIRGQIGNLEQHQLAVLVDDKTEWSSLAKVVQGAVECRYFTWQLELLDQGGPNGEFIEPVGCTELPSDCIWLIACGNPLSGFALNRRLLEMGVGVRRIVKCVRFVETTNYYSYIDFFNGTTSTLIQIHNYFERCYRLPFPLDVWATLKDENGRRITDQQLLIPPGGIANLSFTDTLGSSEFKGYVEIEFEVPIRVQPFLHYYATYSSNTSISCNHQSGLGLHPARSSFTRGFLPSGQDETLYLAMFQRNYTNPVKAIATLYYIDEENQRKKLLRELPPLNRGALVFLDTKTLFPELKSKVFRKAYVEVAAEVPLHRPNYYYSSAGIREFYDIHHGGPDPRVYETNIGSTLLPKRLLSLFRQNKCNPFQLTFFIPPPSLGIESLAGFVNDTTAPVRRLNALLYDCNGVSASEEIIVDIGSASESFVSLTDLFHTHGYSGFCGSVVLSPTKDEENIPIVMNALSGYQHNNGRYMTCTAAAGATPDNIPFYYKGGPPTYLGQDSASGVTDIYVPIICNKEYESWLLLSYPSASFATNRSVRYQIQLFNSVGYSVVVEREIYVRGTAYLACSDLLMQTGLSDPIGSYTLWVKCLDAHLYGQRLLIRHNDNAIAVEHLYPGKFGL